MSAELAIAMLLIGFFVICSVLGGIALMSLTFNHRPPMRAIRTRDNGSATGG
ncbi:hypothetical protein ABIE65_000620 [Constrictibacter sp. MBR-5]|jgi:hypothetical protein|uniref:hypothetical protein n=1 Tax=Constrictibacter sp. MBR-5 TaxID=3156467 RepID=UPI003390FC6D